MASISFEKITLSNGLDVILHQDHTIPVAAVNVWYHVGSKDEEMGRTGFAHLFEHVMFEGSENHNSSFFEPLQKAGANLNGSTTPDRTNYWEDVPSNYLELALWLEADRMGFLLGALDQKRLDIQRDVVKNERRQSYENRPYGMAHWHIQEALYPLPHPYHWMTIGSQEDLDAASLDDIKDFFRQYYAPSNASLAIAGDFQRDDAVELVNRYFGDLPPGPALTRKGRLDSPLAGRVELEIRDRVSLPRVYVSWPTPPDFSIEDAPLELLQSVLSDGLSSRLHRSLVYEKQIAQSASIMYNPGEAAGQFTAQVTAAPGHTLEEAEAALDAEIERLRKEPPTDEEISRVKNRLESSHYRQLAKVGGFGGRADQLNHFNVFANDPELINTSLDRYMAVQREDILHVSETILDHRQVRLKVLPEQSLHQSSTVALDRTLMPQPGDEPSFAPPVPQRQRLDNGLEILVVEQPGIPLVAFGLMLSGGAIDDPQNLPGLASFTSQMLAEGTTSRTSLELAADFEFIGSRLSTDARREFTLLATETLVKHWPTALGIMADMVRNPTFPEHELERVRRELLTDMSRGKDDPNYVAEIITPGLIFSKESGYGHPIHGTEAAISSLTRDDVVRKFKEAYGPEGSTLLVAGDVTLEEAVKQAQEALGSWAADAAIKTPGNGAGNGGQSPAKSGNTNNGTTIFLVDKPGAAQSVIRALQTTIPRHHPDYFGLLLLNYSFGGQFSARLNQNLRQDKGYSYGYNSGIAWSHGTSLLSAGGSVQTAVTKESVVETLKEFNDVHSNKPITEEELDSAKAGILQSYPASFERPGQVINQLLQLTLFDLPNNYFQSVKTSIEGVSLGDVQRIGSELVEPDGLSILVVGDREAIEPGLRELELPVVLLTDDGTVNV